MEEPGLRFIGNKSKAKVKGKERGRTVYSPFTWHDEDLPLRGTQDIGHFADFKPSYLATTRQKYS